jgi:hypothetical protein
VRAFTPLGALLAIIGLGNRGFVRDRLFLLWGISTVVVMALLADKLHHEYYWLLLAPAAAFGVGTTLDRIASAHAKGAIVAALAMVSLCAIQVRSTWYSPADWNGLSVAATALRAVVPPETWVAAPEALLYAADRHGCRMEWTGPAARRAAGEWGGPNSVRCPADLLDHYRRHGACYFADLGGTGDDPERMVLHDFVRRRYKVIVDRREVIVADLVNSRMVPHAN